MKHIGFFIIILYYILLLSSFFGIGIDYSIKEIRLMHTPPLPSLLPPSLLCSKQFIKPLRIVLSMFRQQELSKFLWLAFGLLPQCFLERCLGEDGEGKQIGKYLVVWCHKPFQKRGQRPIRSLKWKDSNESCCPSNVICHI